jgi:hypothetical protein
LKRGFINYLGEVKLLFYQMQVDVMVIGGGLKEHPHTGCLETLIVVNIQKGV